MRTSIIGRSCYFGSLARRAREAEGASDAAYLKERYHRNDTETVIRLFESQPSLHSNPMALTEYVKALVKVDRLHERELLKILHRGLCIQSSPYQLSSVYCFLQTLLRLC